MDQRPASHDSHLRGTRAVRCLTAVVILATLLACGVVPARSRAAVASHLTLALTTQVRLGPLRVVAQRSAYVVLQPWESSVARALKHDNPDLKVLVYQNFGSISAAVADDGLSSSGVPYAQARNTHGGWFLTTPTGARIQESGYPYLFMADVGDRGYQRRWTADVVSLLRHGPWDGVFMDDVNASPRPEAGSAAIAQYPTDAAYARAVGSMLGYAGPRIRATGKLAIANIGEWADHPALARRWLRDLDGGMDEKFVKWSAEPNVGYRAPRQWLSQEREVLSTEAMGKRFLAVTDAAPSDTRAQLYGWASLLLAAGGRASYLAAETYSGAEPWLNAYRSHLGRPLGPMAMGPGGIYRRSFAGGLVVVNPTRAAVHVSLGSRFSGSGLRDVRTTTLGPERALVLLRVSAPATTRRSPIVIVVVVLLGFLLLLARWRRRGPPSLRGGARSRSDAPAGSGGPRGDQQAPPRATRRPRSRACQAESPPPS
jgi:hypothetical protein